MATELEEAQALGFDSIEAADKHAAWLKANRERHERAREYQTTEEAAARRAAAGVPADTWVIPYN